MPKKKKSINDGDGGTDKYVLRLYVTGRTSRSEQAIRNIRRICEDELEGHYDLEIVDIYQQPDLASKDQILAAPTLIRKLPLPLRKLVGDLSDKEKVVAGLQLVPKRKKQKEDG